MKVWIVWLPNVWKSTLFNVLTKSYAAEAANFPFCTIEPNSWIVNVNDERLEILQKAVNGQKIVPANVEFVDIAWIVKWASQGEWLWNKFLANIREADAILQVVRYFEDSNIHHVDWSVNPARDIEIINSELILADLETLDKRIWENVKKARSWDKEANAKQEIYERLKPHLDSWNLAITLDLNEEEKSLIKDLFLLTNKPFIYAINLSENDINMPIGELRKKIWMENMNIPVIPICVKLELDMMEYSPDERKEFLASFWITSNPTDELIKT
ncbi:MAG: GTP-binding protein YchF, partial [uncultured bacterium (gcode 4)]